MRIKGIVTRLLITAALTVAMAGGTAVTASPAMAAPTRCKTLNLTGNWQGFAINPRMTVPICYNGSKVWRNGNVTPGISTVGFYFNGFDWYDTYGSGNWLGAGENFSATTWANTFTVYCTPRWGINAQGNVTSYSRNC